jgi:hypothetical protein
MHQHKAIPQKSQDIGWTHCVTPDECAANPMRVQAHGNIIQVDTCSCGATRHTEVNGGRKNYGPWSEDTTEK